LKLASNPRPRLSSPKLVNGSKVKPDALPLFGEDILLMLFESEIFPLSVLGSLKNFFLSSDINLLLNPVMFFLALFQEDVQPPFLLGFNFLQGNLVVPELVDLERGIILNMIDMLLRHEFFLSTHQPLPLKTIRKRRVRLLLLDRIQYLQT
jgi:hypothetical protein